MPKPVPIAPIEIYAPTATHIDLCLHSGAPHFHETDRIALIRSGDRWHAPYLTLPAGQRYSLRADGPDAPAFNARFSPGRLLLDPRARAIARLPAPLDPIGAIVDSTFEWDDDRRPQIARGARVIYEAHVKGLTALHPAVPAEWRGTFLGLTVPAVIDHLLSLGVTTLELLPVHAHADELALTARGLTNYWGYNSLSFFAPDPRFATSAWITDPTAPVREFKTMVCALHRAGIEVILDVVFNHTAEGPLADGDGGRTLSLRGLDPVNAYRRSQRDPTRCEDWTGCGNTLNVDDPFMRALVLDSVRYWANDMRVDGFRFDLASAIDRSPWTPSSLFHEIRNDSSLADLLLIAEPWDATGDGYRLGAFPPGIAEWNGRYRDTVRRFWRGDTGTTGELATRISGSQDLFGAPSRSPLDSINFVISHDGFTLADLVSYEDKHNEANGESNRDGESNNFGSNAGIEGASTDPAITAERDTRARSLMATLALSVGVPMISGGDELGRSQRGNNNAYCQDSVLSWTPWPGDSAFADFTRRCFAIRRAHPALQRSTFLTPDDVWWIGADGGALTDTDWQSETLQCLGAHFADGKHALLIYFNGSRSIVRCVLPADAQWQRALDSSAPHAPDVIVDAVLSVNPGSVVVLTPAYRR